MVLSRLIIIAYTQYLCAIELLDCRWSSRAHHSSTHGSSQQHWRAHHDDGKEFKHDRQADSNRICGLSPRLNNVVYLLNTSRVPPSHPCSASPGVSIQFVVGCRGAYPRDGMKFTCYFCAATIDTMTKGPKRGGRRED